MTMNYDVLTEILSCLPIKSLLKFRVVCKIWCNIIDSRSFGKLHAHNDKSDDMVQLRVARSNEHDKVCLKVTLPNVGNQVQKKRLMNLQRNWKSLRSYEADPWFDLLEKNRHKVVPFKLAEAVKGLICMYPYRFGVPIAICNPFLRQLKLLPLTASSLFISGCEIDMRSVAIGFDEDYKVVQLLLCLKHSCLHAQVYSRRTDSWKELADLEFNSVIPIKSRCKNGYFAHWCVEVQGGIVSKILSLDMKNEVFRAITLPKDYTYCSSVDLANPISWIFAEDDHSFRLFDITDFRHDNIVRIYESRCEGSELSWNHVMEVKVPFMGPEELCRTGCVFFMYRPIVIVYDYRAHKLSQHSKLQFGYDRRAHNMTEWINMDRIVEYKESLLSLEN
ncbi:F-box protein-like protein [Salvia divinorum]|uniref:F-box protein-like protein n=1 Tax=Salvia divinorum TaxID=28513 RepID=A0ABD1HPH3_SALDI